MLGAMLPLCLAPFLFGMQAESAHSQRLRLWYTAPASQWVLNRNLKPASFPSRRSSRGPAG